MKGPAVMKSVPKIIYCVDDNHYYLRCTCGYLSENYNVYALSSGKHLLKLLEMQIADLILLEVEIEDMDGWETITYLKENATTKNIPVIFVSSNSSDEDMEKGMSLGAVDYIAKPYLADDLIEKVRSHLDD